MHKHTQEKAHYGTYNICPAEALSGIIDALMTGMRVKI